MPAMGILVLHRPEVFLKPMLEDFFCVEVHTPEASHAGPRFLSIMRKLRHLGSFDERRVDACLEGGVRNAFYAQRSGYAKSHGKTDASAIAPCS
jgi:hypothetical protein